MSNLCMMVPMETSEISRMVVEMPATDKEELKRLARARYDRTMGSMIRVIVRDWIAAEHAHEAEDAAA